MVTTPEPFPSTPAALLGRLRESIPDDLAAKSAATLAHDVAWWVQAREPAEPHPYAARLLRAKGGKTARKAGPTPPTIFPPGTAAPFHDYARTLDRLPELLDALEVLAGRPAAPAARAAPLYYAPELDDPWAPYYPHNDAAVLDDPRQELVDVLTLKPVAPEARADYLDLAPSQLPWWPKVPTELAAIGINVLACPPAELETGGYAALPAYLATMAYLNGRGDGYMRLFRSVSEAGVPNRARRSLQTAAIGYRTIARHLEPIGDLMVADLAQYLDTASAATAALAPLNVPGDAPMPALAATSSVVTTLAAQIRDAVTAGHGGRITVAPGSEVAFSWSPGVAATLLNYLATGTAAGRSTTVVVAQDSGDPITGIPEGGTKPDAVDFTSDEVDLVKYAGIASISVESSQFVNNIEAAVSTVMTSRILRGIEADAVAAITAGAGVAIAGAADITAGVLDAIAQIRSNGGAATVVGLSAADWIATMTATGASGYLNFSNPEAGPAGTWLGLYPVILPTLAANSAVVLDGSAVTVLETEGGPLCVVDPFTGLGTNAIRIAIETWAASVVNAPGGVATIAVTPVE